MAVFTIISPICIAFKKIHNGSSEKNYTIFSWITHKLKQMWVHFVVFACLMFVFFCFLGKNRFLYSFAFEDDYDNKRRRGYLYFRKLMGKNANFSLWCVFTFKAFWILISILFMVIKLKRICIRLKFLFFFLHLFRFFFYV